MLTLTLSACLAAVAPRPSTIPALPTWEGVTLLGSEAFPLPPEGEDATAAIQGGIDRGGVVVLPSGTWRVSRTLDLWKGVRLVGVGATRPILEVAPGTEAFAGGDPAYVVRFRSDRPKTGEEAKDGNNDTFGSGLMNLAIRIGSDNPAAWAIRYRVAQLCILEGLDLDLAPGTSGIREMASVIQDVHIHGGDQAITSGSPLAWQCLIADSAFIGQSTHAISSHGCAPMILRCSFDEVPVALHVPDGKSEQHLVEDSRFHAVGAVLATETEYNGFHALNLIRCQGTATPVLVQRRDRPIPAPTADWSLRRGRIGQVMDLDATDEVRDTVDLEVGTVELMPPRSWVFPDQAQSLLAFGADRRGEADATEALRTALREAGTVYLPPGRYRISDTVEVGDGQALIGLHCRATVIAFDDAKAAGFADSTAPKAVIAVAAGATAMLRGLALPPVQRPGAVVLWWKGGADSQARDLWSSWGPKDGKGGITTCLIEGSGTFSNLWFVDPTTTHALIIRGSQGPGRIEMASLEHHHDEELVIEDSAGWSLHGLQTERGDYGERPAITLRRCRDLLFGNAWLYRTSSSRAPRDAAIHLESVSGFEIAGLRVFAGTWNGGVNYRNALRRGDDGKAVAPTLLAGVRIP